MKVTQGYRFTCTILVLLTLVGSQFVSFAGETQSLLKMKPGICTFSLLDSAGVKPLKGATLLLSSAKDGRVVAKLKANAAGKCITPKMVEGRYILTVDGKRLVVIDVVRTAKITECRIVVPEQGVLVGGEEATVPPAAPALAAGGSFKVVMIGGVAVLVWVAAEVIDDNTGSDGGQDSGPASI